MILPRNSSCSIARARNPDDPEGVLYAVSRLSAERRFGVADRGESIGRAAEVVAQVAGFIGGTGHVPYRDAEGWGAFDRCSRFGPERVARPIGTERQSAGAFVQWDREPPDRHVYFHLTGTRCVGQRPFPSVAFGTQLPCADWAAVAALAAALGVRMPAAARIGFRHHGAS